jgi:hypothetical protein
MTVDEYYASVRRLGLRLSKVPHIYTTHSLDVYSVPDASKLTSEQRVEALAKLKELLGIAPTRRIP